MYKKIRTNGIKDERFPETSRIIVTNKCIMAYNFISIAARFWKYD